MKAVILDVDQVLLDYMTGLRTYVNHQEGKDITGHPESWGVTEWLNLQSQEDADNLIEEFSKDYQFGLLEPLPGSKQVLTELRLSGCLLVCVTSCGYDYVTMALRKCNLVHVFGDIFEEIHFVDSSESKRDVVEDIANRYEVLAFVDDRPKNLLDCIDVGIKNFILMKSPHNREFRKVNDLNIHYAYSWYDCKAFIKDFS